MDRGLSENAAGRGAVVIQQRAFFPAAVGLAEGGDFKHHTLAGLMSKYPSAVISTAAYSASSNPSDKSLGMQTTSDPLILCTRLTRVILTISLSRLFKPSGQKV
jgi:hypothetical protein